MNFQSQIRVNPRAKLKAFGQSDVEAAAAGQRVARPDLKEANWLPVQCGYLG
jgi:hypothetical protein